MTKERLEELFDQILFWAMEVINDDEELYNTARNSWGFTEEECKSFELVPQDDGYDKNKGGRK